MTKLEISYEVYPFKGEDCEKKNETLLNEIEKLEKFEPALISVTYGAGGSNRVNSLTLVKKLVSLKLNVMPHFTCVCSNKNYIEQYLKEVQDLGIKNILALRGDEPKDIDVCYKDFTYAFELVDFIKKETSLDIAVAGYPEKHPRAKTMDEDIENLKKKIDLGAKKVYTQLFFDNKSFCNFKELCSKKDINVPIIAGILPVTNFSQLEKMAQMCGAKLPNKLIQKIEKFKDNNKDIVKAGIEYAVGQCKELIEYGVKGFHFYTLNKSHSTSEILKEIL